MRNISKMKYQESIGEGGIYNFSNAYCIDVVITFTGKKYEIILAFIRSYDDRIEKPFPVYPFTIYRRDWIKVVISLMKGDECPTKLIDEYFEVVKNETL